MFSGAVGEIKENEREKKKPYYSGAIDVR